MPVRSRARGRGPRYRRSVIHPTTERFLAEFVIGAVAGAIVFLHADRNGSRHPTAWACATFVLPVVVVLVYLYHVRRARRR